MSAIPKTKLSPQEYLIIERESAQKSEYYKGEVFAMAGAGNNHNIITANIISEIHRHLKGKIARFTQVICVCIFPKIVYTPILM